MTPTEIRSALNVLGYGPVPATGFLAAHVAQLNNQDSAVSNAIKSFQGDHSLDQDKVAGPITQAALVAALANSGDPNAQALIAGDNAATPANVTAAHLPATSTSPAMTVHTTTGGLFGTTTSTKPYGTPTSTTSKLAQITGAKPGTSAPLAVKASAMSTGMKLGIAAAVAAVVGIGLAKKRG